MDDLQLQIVCLLVKERCLARHIRFGIIIGEDEVSGSNPDSSSKKTPVTAMVTGVFCFYETPAFLSFGVNLG